MQLTMNKTLSIQIMSVLFLLNYLRYLINEPRRHICGECVQRKAYTLQFRIKFCMPEMSSLDTEAYKYCK